MFRKVIVGFLVLVASAGTALAAHPLITDDTGTQGPGKFQIELNGEMGWDKQHGGGVETKAMASQAAATFTAGLSDTVDFVVGVPWLWNRGQENGVVTTDNNGISDTTIELKWRFLQSGGFSLAAKPGLIVPSGNSERGLGNGKLSYKGTLIATQEFEPFTVHANFSYTRNEFKVLEGPDTNRHDIYHLSVAGLYEVIKNLKLVTNVGFESNSSAESQTWPAFLIGGVIYSPVEYFDIDFGAKGGLNKAETDITVMAGVTYRF